jgi:hypothetical protein
MVIERSTGYIFQIPADISGEQVKNITLIYNAIVHRSFVWPIADIGYGLPATKEALNYLLTLNQLTSATFPGYPITIPLFDKVISLGHANITIHDKIIENFNEIQKEMAHDDGHIVKFVVRSLSGHGRYDMSEAPRLPDKPWDEKIERLIDLEGQLDAAIVAKYHTLAASTLEGLSEEEKAAITARPELDENAFVD